MSTELGFTIVIGILVIFCVCMEMNLLFPCGHGENTYIWQTHNENDPTAKPPCAACNTQTVQGKWKCLTSIANFQSVKWRKHLVAAALGAALYVTLKDVMNIKSNCGTFIMVTLLVFFCHIGTDNFSSFHGVDASHRHLSNKMIQDLSIKQ